MDTHKFESWCIVELFGHQRIAGLVTEQTIGGCNFVRVDVPAIGDVPAYTKLLGQGAIYAINPVSETVASTHRSHAEALRQGRQAKIVIAREVVALSVAQGGAA